MDTLYTIDYFCKYKIDILCHELLNFLLLKIVKNVSTLDPGSVIFLLKNYTCAFTDTKKDGSSFFMWSQIFFY